MAHTSLLSNAYGAALFAARATLLEAELRHRSSASAGSAEAQAPLPAPEDDDEDALPPQCHGAPPATGAEASHDEDDDMETARTRPLRLDRIHL